MADDDLDVELDGILQSAKKLKRKRTRKTTRASDDSDDDYGVTSAQKKKGRARRRGRASDSDTPAEEGDSDDSDEESDEGSEEEEEDDGYGPDLMGDELDRANLMAMTEIQREKILSERSEQREARRARIALKRKAREVERREKNAQLQKSMDKKAKRQAKEAQRAARRAAKLAARDERSRAVDENKALTKRSVFSNINEEMEQAPAAEAAQLSTTMLPVIRKSQISRLQLTEWQWLPNFSDIVKDCFVRVLIGANALQQKVYRVAQIVRVTKYHRVYEFEKKPTDRAFELRIGTSKRVFQLSFVSNMAITQAELDIFFKALQSANLRFPTARSLEPMIEALEAAGQHQMTPEEHKYMVAEKSRIRNKPRNHVTERAELERMLQLAMQEDQSEEVKRLENELEELNYFANETIKKRDEHLNTLAEVNRRNREKQMQIELEWAKKMETSNHDDNLLNPFARRRPVISTKKITPVSPNPSTSVSGGGSPATVQPGNDPTKPSTAPAMSSPLTKIANSPVMEPRKNAVNVHELLDVDLDATPAPLLTIPVPAAAIAFSSTPKPPQARPTAGHTRSYNLSTYNAKHGII